jgi:ribonuclease R
MKHTFTENEKITGIVKYTGKNFGFLITKKGDVFVPPQEYQKVFIGDHVVGHIFFKNGNPQVCIDKITKYKYTDYLGVFIVTDKGNFVKPEDKNKECIHHWLRIPKSKRKKAVDGDIVRVSIIEYPIENKKPKGEIVKVIGNPESPNFEANYIFEQNNLPIYFSNDIQDKASEYDENVIIQKTTDSNRKNLTMRPFVTIDGENTKDIDDALFCKKTENGWKVWVAISDVTEFVKKNDIIDQEAYKRTSSVYTPLRYVAMIPENLSSNLCSLVPDMNRLAFVCYIELSKEGEIMHSSFMEATIRSKARISYNELESYMNGDIELEHEQQVVNNVKNLCELHTVLNNYRKKNFLVNPRQSNVRYVLDENRQVKDVELIEYKKSNAVVEEMMLLANISAAKFLNENYEKAVYRANAGFINNEAENFKNYMESKNIHVPENFQVVEGYRELFAELVNSQDMLDILPNFISPSRFSLEPNQHFGLGVNKYTYFTSPIRRYADILVHRIIKNVLRKEQKEEISSDVIEHLNEKRVQLDNISNQVQKMMNAKLMMLQEIQTYNAFIYSISKNGVCVRIKDMGIEGIIPIQSFGEIMTYNNKEKTIKGSTIKLKLGDYIKVDVQTINKETSTIEFRYLS